MEVLRIATAGSVDDGKSTLIGRLLYETGSIPEDKLRAIETASRRKGTGFTDLSLLTDGLIAEREQGITIDVAHIYFRTASRKYIIADSPGHVEYTRNMITGASKADVSVILVDARHGITEQTHRHYYIANLLRIPNVVVCVNKMDLIDYDRRRFQKIKDAFIEFRAMLDAKDQQLDFVPISALRGENVTRHADNMLWYSGPTLLEMLEETPAHHRFEKLPARLPIQYVIRPRDDAHHDFRGYAGKLLSGSLTVGDEVLVLPSQQKSVIKEISQHGQRLDCAHAHQSVVVLLEDDIDISRGDVIVKHSELPALAKDFEAQLCWMDSQPMVSGKIYLLQQGTAISKAKVMGIDFIQKPDTLQKHEGTELKMNDLAKIRIRTARPVVHDRYAQHRAHGNFILIDEYSNTTAAVGFIL